MSVSAIDICNLALVRLGQAPIQAFPPAENSEEARKCAYLYDRIRRTALRAHPWNFATTTAVLAQLTTAEAGWDYRYQIPADCLRGLHIVNASEPGDDTIPYELRAGGVLVTNEPNAQFRYIVDVTDATYFDEQFIEAFSYRLAADLAMPLTGKAEYANAMTGLFNTTIRAAMTSDAKERRRSERIGKSFVDARK